MDIIVGTAGHIDHGKTALVRALTGTDTDRLPEEKKRGITVDLGFAEMIIGETRFGFVDVPGHERFVKNMLAGATGIDLVLLVIAADEGVMPQTREHFDICRLLDIRSGIVVLTKIDLADAETLELARLDAAELIAGSFLEDAPVIEVSARAGLGLGDLSNALALVADRLGNAGDRSDQKAARMAIDRSFSVKGFGAVVTGTLATGSIAEGDEVELLPPGRMLRVRGVQSHGTSVREAHAGSRTALNLAGIDRSELFRGMTIALPGVFAPTQIIDAHVEMLASSARPLKNRQRVRLHLGTDELLARVQVLNGEGEVAPGGSDFVQLRLENETVAAAGDRFIIRSYSPQATIGGGEVLDSAASRHRKSALVAVREHLASLLEHRSHPVGQVIQYVKFAGRRGLTGRELSARTGRELAVIRRAVSDAAGTVTDLRGRFVDSTLVDAMTEDAKTALARFHKANPLEAGMPKLVLREKIFARLPAEIFGGCLERLEREGSVVVEKDVVRLAEHSTQMSPAESVFKSGILRTLAEAGLQPPKFVEIANAAQTASRVPPAAAKKIIQMAVTRGEIVKVSEEFYFSRAAVDDLVAKLKAFAEASPDRTIDMAQFKDLAGVTRKHAIPLSEYFDRERITVRRGDKRVII
jgi:selenocysteine-specific elongation factor